MEKKHRCRVCGKEFYSIYGLKKHTREEHKFRYYFPRIGLPIIISIILLAVGLAFTLTAKAPATITTVIATTTEQIYTATETSITASTTASTISGEASMEYPEAPSFQLREYGSDKMVSLEGFKGRPVFLEFFSPYCPHCLNMIPRVEQLCEKYGDRVVFIMVSYGEKGVDEVKEKYNPRPVILIDIDGEVFRRYNVGGVPSFFILDRKHRVVWRGAGEMDVEALESALGNVL